MNVTQIAGGIVLVDITDELPRHRTKRYRLRTAPIKRVFFHHSGSLGNAGKHGVIASARYAIRPPSKSNPKKVAYAGFNYHFWIPWLCPDTGEPVTIYRGNADFTMCAHTKTANAYGVGVCLQGNTSTDGMSQHQIEACEALIPWLMGRYNLTLPQGLSWHSDESEWGPRIKKRACPGKAAVEWLRAYRDNS